MARAERDARQAEAEQTRREEEDRVLARVAGLRADDHSLAAEQTRETAASIIEHREMAAKRRMWTAADALGVTPAVVPDARELAYAAMTSQQWYEAYADLLESLPRLAAHGLLDADLVIYEATRRRSAQGMALAAEALPQLTQIEGDPGG